MTRTVVVSVEMDADALAEIIAPRIERILIGTEVPAVPKPAAIPTVATVIPTSIQDAVTSVVRAMNRFDADQHTRGERAALRNLLSSVRQLRAISKKGK
ncbi:hypothetical protein [Oryzifoliimicrobium ureilyticus]|uniref:hypothetical protein n=1 Tax=Oryzifoliimicrobium ureilyticus TaxID=3113724 RepID=UPI0030761E99